MRKVSSKLLWVGVVSSALLGAIAATGPYDVFIPVVVVLVLGLIVAAWRSTISGRRKLIALGTSFTVFAAVVTAAHFAPLKYEDRMVEIENPQFHSGPHGLYIRTEAPPFGMSFPPGTQQSDVALPSGKVSIRTLVSNIERSTGLEASIPRCGTGASILRGSAPIGGIWFREAQQRHASDRFSATPSAPLQSGG